MMSEAHSAQMDLLIGFIVFLFVVVIGTVVLGQMKKKKSVSEDQKSLAPKKTDSTQVVTEVTATQSTTSQPTAALNQGVGINTGAASDVAEVKLKEALKNTEANIFGRIKNLFSSGSETAQNHFEEIEEVLYTSDLGPATVQRLMGALESKLSRSEKANFDTVKATLKEEMKNIFSSVATSTEQKDLLSRLQWASEGPTVLMIVGVNGAGKTTSIGKISALLAGSGKKVLVAAGDTFRAAAGGQLKVWTERAQVEIFSPEGVTDPSAVAFDAVAKAKAGGYDVVIVDTAGRLHTQANLMEELKKMKRVMTKVIESAPHETLIVLDANSGQNALMQAKEFHNSLTLTGAILTKMDGTAKGGVAVGLAQELKIPIKLIGVGERLQDLRSFDYVDYVDSIVG